MLEKRYTKKKIKVVIADDSAFFRARNVQYLSEVPYIDIVGQAKNGLEVIQSLEHVKPDVIVSDVEMPNMTGMELVRQVKNKHKEVAILLISSAFFNAAEFTFESLKSGADDFLMKPISETGAEGVNSYKLELQYKVKKLYIKNNPGHDIDFKDEVPSSINKSATSKIDTSVSDCTLRRKYGASPRVVVIGSSTGGPDALIRVLSDLVSVSRKIPILVTQHIMVGFSKILAEQLSKNAGVNCVEAYDGQALLPNRVYLAPGGKHMYLANSINTHIKLNDAERINHHKPSVDPLFSSAAEIYGSATLAIMLTGIGSDGLEGTKKIAKADGSVIAQDKKTSVVWGMPGSVAKSGYANAILPIDKIGEKVKSLTQLREVG